jgi:DNA-binding CsgD family transcriptional regulator
VPRAEARVAEELGSEIGVTLRQMVVLALTVAHESESAIAAELRVSEDTVKRYRARIARRAGQASLGPLAQRARKRAVGEAVELLPAGWRSARKYPKREREREAEAHSAGRLTYVRMSTTYQWETPDDGRRVLRVAS